MKLRLRWYPHNHLKGVYFDLDFIHDSSTSGPGWFSNYDDDPWQQIVKYVKAGHITDGSWVYDSKEGRWINPNGKQRENAPRREHLS